MIVFFVVCLLALCLFGSQRQVFKVDFQPSYLRQVRKRLIQFDCRIVLPARLMASATDYHKALPPRRTDGKTNDTAGTYLAAPS